MDKFNWMKKACALLLLCATAGVALPAQTFTTLHSFDGTDGASPEAGLVQGTDGSLYGTTAGGADGYGTVFKITPSGTLTTLHSFHGPDGASPEAGLVQATNGNLYGTTLGGGANGVNGIGTVFKITPSGTLTTLHSFDNTDGALPAAGLVQATNGTFYGTTEDGGASGFGTVFKITPSGTLTTLHSFDNTDGAFPAAGLIRATNGDFYGTTIEGGAHDPGDGTVFSITASGTLTTLHSFDGRDGEHPDAGLIQATNGDFYGTTSYGGADGLGTVFKIASGGKLTTLHSFDYTDGDYPTAGLVQGTDGNFYGTTSLGGGTGCGGGGCGTVFRITPGGTLTTLHSFIGTDGAYPDAGLVQATNGNFYGTTAGDAISIDGTVFSLSVGLGPFVETQPTSRMVGAAVKILGTNLTDATSVTFNGTAATFTVVSASEITTTVPNGATTGTVQVVTPGGTLSSNVPFTVTP